MAKIHNTNLLLAEEKLKAHEQEKILMNLKLDYKKKDLADMALSISQRQEWAKELFQRIENIESLKGNKRNREFRNLKEDVRSRIHVDIEIEHLRQNIEMLNREFYDKLSKQFAGLSKTDIKLCTFIKLGLTNSQIAHLQIIDPASVKVSRYRLKKKLNLSPDQDLDTFIKAL